MKPFALVSIVALWSSVLVAQQARPQPPGDGVQVGVPRGSETDQQRDEAEQRRIAALREQRAKRPVPRAADGHIVIGQTSNEKGVWLPGPVIANPLGFTDIPYQLWAKALAADRRTHQLEPHARCKPSGVARQF